MKRVHPLPCVILMVLLPLLVGCEDGAPSDEQRQAVEETVSGYLMALAESYSTLSVTPLEAYASPVELDNVLRLLKSLAQTGDRVDSTLTGYHIEAMEIFREINATVRLLEVWEVVRYDAFSGREKGRTPDSIQSSIIQLRKIDGKWMVVGRTVTGRETPVPTTPIAVVPDSEGSSG